MSFRFKTIVTAKMADDPTNLIINYIAPNVDEMYLLQLFSLYGPIVKLNIVRDRSDNHSLGYGFVKFTNAIDATSAIQQVNGLEIGGKKLRVAVAVNRDMHSGSGKKNLYVAGIPLHWTEEELTAAFQCCGTVEHSQIFRNLATGLSRGVGFVHYSTTEEASAAILNMNNVTPEDGSQPLTVKYVQKKAAKDDNVNGNNSIAQQGTISQCSEMADDPTNLIINFLASEIDETYLTQLFSPYGSIQKLNIVRDRKDNHSLGYGFVKFENVEDAATAVAQLNGQNIGGKAIRVAVAGGEGGPGP